MSSMKLGIAFYSQTDSRNRPTSPHWALIAHPTDFNAHNVKIFQVRITNGLWVLAHNLTTGCYLASTPSLLGVVDLGCVSVDYERLRGMVGQFGAGKDGSDPSGNIMWSCSGWVIRVLDYLVGRGWLNMPVGVDMVYDHMLKRVNVLKVMQQNPYGVTVIPFCG